MYENVQMPMTAWAFAVSCKSQSSTELDEMVQSITLAFDI